MSEQTVMGAILAAIGEVVAACKRATGEDELIDREVGPLLVPIAERAQASLGPPAAWQVTYIDRHGVERTFTHDDRRVAEFAEGMIAYPLYAGSRQRGSE